jgi:SAM-dependent methyltransferase
MRASLLALLRCPACGGELDALGEQARPPEIWEGDLRCIGCGAVYPVQRGIPHLYIHDPRWAPKAREAQGWVDFHKERGIYIQPEDAVDLKIPYYPEEPWIAVAKSFDIAMEELASFLRPGMVVLHLGAGRGWAAKQFALRGCQAVALDIAPDENVGLGRAWALMKHAGVYFDPIIADGEQLPLLPESFDLVFCAATLHHTSDLPLFMKNIQRVLKPGGMLCAIGEPCIAIDESAERILARDAGSELRHGINEQRPNLVEYWGALSSAGFEEINFIWPPGYRLSMPELTNCAKDLGAMLPGWSEHGWRTNLKRWGFYSYHQVASLPRRRAVGGLPVLEDERQRLMCRILLWVSGEVQIFARRHQVL